MKMVESMSKKAKKLTLNQKKMATRTAREGNGDCVTDFAVPHGHETEHQRDELKRLDEDPDFKTAQEIEELTNAANDFIDEGGVPSGAIAKAEWVASRIAERRIAKKINDGVLNHLASMGSTVGMIACARVTDKRAFDEYRADYETRAKHASRKPRLKTKEARFKAWASRKVAFGGDCEIFIGAVSNPSNGDWLKLPASDSEIQDAIERAQTGPDGEFYEEVMISDTSGLGNSVDEYSNIESVNEWVEAIEDSGMDEDLIEALLSEYDLEYVADNIDDVDYWSDVNDEMDLGYRIIEELGLDGISDEDKQMYFDYEGFGRDIVINDGYTIDNGFAYRVASRTALACEMDARRMVALVEKHANVKSGGSDMSMAVRDWYMLNFSDDEFGENINPNLTFDGLNNVLMFGVDVYDALGVADSVVRERAFDGLSEVSGLSRDAIYNLWQSKTSERRANLKEKVKTKVKTCGKMVAAKKSDGKAATMKKAQQDGWQGEGWYTFNPWNKDTDDWKSPQKPEAVWVENQYDFDEFAGTSQFGGDYEMVVDYYGDGDQPNDPEVPVAEWFK